MLTNMGKISTNTGEQYGAIKEDQIKRREDKNNRTEINWEESILNWKLANMFALRMLRELAVLPRQDGEHGDG